MKISQLKFKVDFFRKGLCSLALLMLGTPLKLRHSAMSSSDSAVRPARRRGE